VLTVETAPLVRKWPNRGGSGWIFLFGNEAAFASSCDNAMTLRECAKSDRWSAYLNGGTVSREIFA
jgi:hypothetical protein